MAEDVERPVQSPNLQVTVSTTFPQSEIFGIKLVNGRPTKAVLSIENQETVPVKISYVGGSLWTLGLGGQESQNVRNLTINRFDLEIAAGQKETITYSFATEIHAQDLRLQLAALIVKEGLQFHSIQAYNETVTVVEAPTSLFDPQLSVSPLLSLFLSLSLSRRPSALRLVLRRSLLLTPAQGFSCTSCSHRCLEGSATSSTRPGSRPSFRRSDGVAKVENELRLRRIG